MPGTAVWLCCWPPNLRKRAVEQGRLDSEPRQHPGSVVHVCQVFPAFQDYSVFSTLPVLYSDGVMDASVRPATANPTMQGVIAILALAANVIVLAIIIKRSVEQKKNPYKNEIFTDHRDYRQAMARAEVTR